MSTNAAVLADPRTHPENANLPTANEPGTILGVTITFLSIAVIAASFRVWVRIRGRLWGWDDTFVVLACITSVVGGTFVCIMPHDGLGLHLWTLDYAHRTSYYRHVYTTNITYCTSATIIKLSILHQYLRLFAETASSTECRRYRCARRLTQGLIVFCAAWGLTFVLLAAFSCRPIAKNWNSLLPGQCIGWGSKDPNTFFVMFLGHSISNMVLDIVVLLLPVPFLGLLRLGGKSRAGLTTFFSLSTIVAIVAVGRMAALSINRAGTIPVMDMSYFTPLVFVFGVLEVNLAIFAASIPTFWPVIAKYASNKIFVVNEIVVEVESAPRDSFGSGSAIVTKDNDNSAGQNSSKPHVLTKAVSGPKDLSNTQSRPSKPSSLGRNAQLDLSFRHSQDMQYNLYRSSSGDNRSSDSFAPSEGEDWFSELDKVNPGGKTTTTVERTGIRLEQLKAFDRR